VTAAERNKGARGEREVAAVLRGFDLGSAVQRAAGGTVQLHGDLTGAPGVFISVKRQEALRLPLWLRQAADEAPDESVPVVAFRQNRGEWYAVLPLRDLARLLDLARLSP
jgi:hypothetical protein